MASTFHDLVYSVYIVAITIGVNYSIMISSKNGFHFAGPSMFTTCIALKTEINYSNRIFSKRGFHVSGSGKAGLKLPSLGKVTQPG